MKKLLLTLAGVALVTGLMAQTGSRGQKRALQERPALYEDGQLRPEAVLWSQNFSNTTGVSFAQTAASSNGWKIISALEPNITAQNFGTTLNSLSGGPFAFINSDSFPNGSQNSSLILKVGVSLAGVSGVQLSFRHYFRRFQEQHIVEVSNDSTAWVIVYNSSQTIPVNTTIPNATLEEINISTVAANQANVWVRFRYVGAWDWFWAVDDVEISDLPPNDLKLEDYSIVPEKRLVFYGTNTPNHKTDSLTFQGAVLNFGTNSQPNTRMTSTIMAGANTLFNNTSSSVTLAGGARDTLESTGGFNLNTVNGSGELVARILLQSDSLDGSPANNEVTLRFNIGDSVMSVARPTAERTTTLGTSSFGADSHDGFILASLIELSEQDTITGIKIRLGNSTPGALIQISVRDTAGLFGTPAGGISFPILMEADLYTLSSADTAAGYVVIPIPDILAGLPQNRVLAAGAYYVAAELYSSSGTTHIRVVDDLSYDRFQPTYASMIYIATDATWYNNGVSMAVEGVFGRVLSSNSSIAELENGNLKFGAVYPNPAQNELNLPYTLKTNAQLKVNVRDLTGRLVYNQAAQHQTAGDHLFTLALDQLRSGVYFVELNANGQLRRQKFVVNR